MRRSLVLTSEFSRHPFRRSLPAHVLRVDEGGEEHEGVLQGDHPRMLKWRLQRDDVKVFLSAYGAGFIAMMAFFY